MAKTQNDHTLKEVRELIEESTSVLNKQLMPNPKRPEAYMLRGGPGLGKTDSMLGLAKAMAKENGYEFVNWNDPNYVMEEDESKRANQLLFVSQQMKASSYLSVLGMMTINEKGQTVYSVPRHFSDALNYKQVFYYFDEVNRMNDPSVLMGLIGEGRCQDTKMAERSLVVMTVNKGSLDGNKNVTIFDSATLTRMAVYDVVPDVMEWSKDFARGNGIHPVVTAFLTLNSDWFENPDFSNMDQTGNIPTLRGAELLSNKIKAVEFKNRISSDGPLPDDADDSKIIRSLKSHVKAHFGKSEELANKFCTLYKLAFRDVIPQVTALLNGKKTDAVEVFLKRLSNERSVSSADYAKLSKEERSKITMETLDNMSIAQTTAGYLPTMAVRMYLSVEDRLTKKDASGVVIAAADPDRVKEERKQIMSNFIYCLTKMDGNVFGMAAANIKPAVDEMKTKLSDAKSSKADSRPDAFLHELVSMMTAMSSGKSTEKNAAVKRVFDGLRSSGVALGEVQASFGR